MRFMFIVQGEGRGHMTQAIALFHLLKTKGHEVTDVVIGSSDRREIPSFVTAQLSCRLHQIQSPNFVTDKENKSINIGKTLFGNLRRAPVFLRSLSQMKSLIEERKPDVIVNFYDFLAGIYYGLYKPKLRFVCIGHQYLASSADFHFAPGKLFSRYLFLLANAITSMGASQRIALSLRKPGNKTNGTALLIWPPLLRKKVTEIKTSNEGFFLTYIVNDGYAEEVTLWAEKNPTLFVEAFWDRKNVRNSQQMLPNLIFHPIDDIKFIAKMAACRGLASTAGFESICEAMYLEKPVMVVPVKGQYEQECNALDTVATGAGISSDQFDFSALHATVEKSSFKDSHIAFKNWYGQQEQIIDSWLEELAGNEEKKMAATEVEAL